MNVPFKPNADSDAIKAADQSRQPAGDSRAAIPEKSSSLPANQPPVPGSPEKSPDKAAVSGPLAK